MPMGQKYLTLGFDQSGKIIQINFKKNRYKSNNMNRELQKKQPDCFVEDKTDPSGFKLKQGFHICHKKSDFTFKAEMKKYFIGKHYDDVINELGKNATWIPKGKKGRADAVLTLLFEKYKQFSTDPENLFVDTEERNGAYAFLSTQVEQFFSTRKPMKREIPDKFYKHLEIIAELKPHIKKEDKLYLIVSKDNIELIRKISDSHAPNPNAIVTTTISTATVLSASATTATPVQIETYPLLEQKESVFNPKKRKHSPTKFFHDNPDASDDFSSNDIPDSAAKRRKTESEKKDTSIELPADVTQQASSPLLK